MYYYYYCYRSRATRRRLIDTFLAFGLDRLRGVAELADAGVRDGRHAVLVLFALGEVGHRRLLADDRRLAHLLPLTERSALLQLVPCNDDRRVAANSQRPTRPDPDPIRSDPARRDGL